MRWGAFPSRWGGRPWQGATVAREDPRWLPATCLGSAWNVENDEDHSPCQDHDEQDSFHLGEGGRRGLGRKTGGVLKRNFVSRIEICRSCSQTLHFISNSVQSTQLLIAELTSNSSVTGINIYTLFSHQAYTCMYNLAYFSTI